MGVEAPRGAGEHARDDQGEHRVRVGADARRLGQALVALDGPQRAPDPRAQEPRRHVQRTPGHDGHQVVVVALGHERQSLGAEIERGHAGQAHGPLGQIHPVGGHEPDHLGEAHRDQHEVGAAEFEGEPAEHIADHPRESGGDGKRPQRRQAIVQGEQARSIRADAEERGVAEIELAGGQEQVHARGQEEEETGHDQEVEVVVVHAHER